MAETRLISAQIDTGLAATADFGTLLCGAGTFAGLPTAGTPGRFYFATDQSLLYRDNGSTWDNVGVPKAYVDAAAVGLSVKASSRLATAAALPANVYANGSSGVGATLTAVSLGALTVDGVAVALGDRILVKDEAAGSHNGIYTVTVLGTGAVLYVLTRASDFDQAAELAEGSFTLIEEGTANAHEGWLLTTAPPYTMGTTALAFAQFSALPEIVAGAGITITGTTIAVTDTAGPGADDTVDAAGAAGAAGAIARAAHGHKVSTTAGPGAVSTVDAAGAAGATGTLARAGHGHEVDSTAGPGADDTIDAAGAAGATGALARATHGHKVATTAGPGAVATVDAAGAAGATGALARAGHGHEVDTTAGPGADVAVDVAGAAGATGAIARAGHGHKLITSAATPTRAGAATAGASGDAPSRFSHVHPGGADADTAWTGDISPAQITADQNDYNPASLATASTLRLNSDAARNLTGLQGGSDGRMLLIHNVGSFSITLKDESASSSAANRFALIEDVVMQPDEIVFMQYDATSSRWRVIAPASTVAGPDANDTIDAAGAAGSVNLFARSGHGHQVVTTAGPGADDTIDAAGAAGATGAIARAGHGHKLSTYTSTPTPVSATAGAAGTSGDAPARGSHRHLGPISSGTLASRPAAGTNGLMYFATDVVGGALFYDNGTSWLLVSPAVAATIGTVVTFNGTSQAASTDVTLFSPWTIPANFLAAGSTFELRLGYDIDIISSATARNLVFKLKFGATAVLTWTMAVQVSTARTNQGNICHVIFDCTATGASGVIRGQSNFNNSIVGQGNVFFAATPVAGVTIDTTASQAITVTVNESVNSVADLVRAESAVLSLMKI